MLQIIKKTYQKLGSNKLFKYAIITNTLFGVGLRSFGDLIQQKIENKQIKNDFKINWTRTSKHIFFPNYFLDSTNNIYIRKYGFIRLCYWAI